MNNKESVQLSNLSLRHLVQELKFIENGFVNNVQTLGNNWIKMKVHTKQGDKNLILAPNALFVSNFSLQAKQSPGGFSALLKKYLFNQRIVSFEQRGADRIIVLQFPEIFLIIELFAKGNLVLCDKEMKIIKAARKEEWKDRKLAQGEQYKFPSSKGSNPLEEALQNFEKNIKESKKTFFGACVDSLNAPPLVLEHVFEELVLEKKKNATEATQKEIKKVFEKIKQIFSGTEKKPFLFEGVVYSTKIGKPKEKEFENINSALNALMLGEKTNEPAAVVAGPASEKKSKYAKETLAKQNQILGLEEQAKQAQEKGEKIYLHYAELKELMGAIEKAKKLGLSEKEIKEKINAKKQLIKELDLKKNKLVVEES